MMEFQAMEEVDDVVEVEDVVDLPNIEEVQAPTSKGTMCIVGRLLSEKAINSFALMDVMKRAWKPQQGFEPKEWSNNLFIFRFDSEADLNWVLANQPWHFEGHLFAIRQLRYTEQPSKVQINRASFWTRIYDIPTGCMNEAAAKSLAKRVGLLEAIDKSNELFGKFLRMKVEVDISQAHSLYVGESQLK